MRTTAFITLAVACLLLSTSADARVIEKRGGILPLGGDGGRGGTGGDGGKGGDSYGAGAAAPGGGGAPGGAGGVGGAANLPLSNTNLPALPDVGGIATGLLGGKKPKKRGLPVRRRLAARAGAVTSEGKDQAQGAADTGKKASGLLGKIPAGPRFPVKDITDKLSLGKRADV
ncbi:hypothetical protein HPULCUR_010482 [Helicostylum pulchrum]|uniref:Uncharacterized protein n=1 Tax=Helicostylum pulchrum TaxID=562976 RepID=A0ABP9YDD5_9FUNG